VNALVTLIQEYGLPFVFLNVLALQAGLPIPAYPTLIVAGAYAAMTGGSIAAIIAVGVLAAVLADTLWYVTGRRVGLRILKTLCRISLSPDSCVRQTENIFERFGPASMIFAKFIPGFASVATALAGAVRLRYGLFVLFDAIGAALWVGVGVALGYLFRDAVAEIMSTLQSLGRYGLLLLLVAFAVWVTARWLRRRMFVRQLRMDRVSVDELQHMLDGEKVTVIVDVRSPLSQAATGRIPGARSVDMDHIADAFVDVETDGDVVVYCQCPNEYTAVKVAQKLRQLGFSRVRPLHGGIDAWLAAGLSVEH
jgi:membrane protein DedA with SNARE-associated domain/rhodanese-related sulfurtransferase